MPLDAFEDRSSSETGDLPSWVSDLRRSRYRVFVNLGRASVNQIPYRSINQDLQETGVLRLTGSKAGVRNFRPLSEGMDAEEVALRIDKFMLHWTTATRGSNEDKMTAEFCRPTGFEPPRPLTTILSTMRSSDFGVSRSDYQAYLAAVLKRLNYQLCDVEEYFSKAIPASYESIFVPAGVRSGDVVMFCSRQATEAGFAYALRRQGDFYRFLGVCLTCCRMGDALGNQFEAYIEEFRIK